MSLFEEEEKEEELKTVFFSVPFSSLALPKTESSCPICYKLFKDESLVVKTSCNHVFCEECLNEWKNHQVSCPLCRKNISAEANVIVID